NARGAFGVRIDRAPPSRRATPPQGADPSGRLPRPLERTVSDVRREDTERPGRTARRADPGPEGSRRPCLARGARGDSRRAPLRRPALRQGDSVAAAPEGRLPRLRAGEGPGALLHPDPRPATDLPRPEGAPRPADVLLGRPHHGREPERLAAAR